MRRVARILKLVSVHIVELNDILARVRHPIQLLCAVFIFEIHLQVPNSPYQLDHVELRVDAALAHLESIPQALQFSPARVGQDGTQVSDEQANAVASGDAHVPVVADFFTCVIRQLVGLVLLLQVLRHTLLAAFIRRHKKVRLLRVRHEQTPSGLQVELVRGHGKQEEAGRDEHDLQQATNLTHHIEIVVDTAVMIISLRAQHERMVQQVVAPFSLRCLSVRPIQLRVHLIINKFVAQLAEVEKIVFRFDLVLAQHPARLHDLILVELQQLRVLLLHLDQRRLLIAYLDVDLLADGPHLGSEPLHKVPYSGLISTLNRRVFIALVDLEKQGLPHH